MPQRFLHMLILLLWLLPGLAAIAEVKTITAEGRFVMGDLDSKSDARKIALSNAKQMALEQAGTYLTSLTTVENYELTGDEISSLSAGLLSVKVISEDWSMADESPVVTIVIEATVDQSDLDEQIASLQANQDTVQEFKQIQDELASLKLELDRLRRSEQPATASDGLPGDAADAGSQQARNTIDRILSLEAVRSADSSANRADPDGAHSDLTRAIELNPSNAIAYLKRARLSASRKDYRAALDDIERALSVQANSANSYALKGQILSQMGDNRSALKALSRAVQINGRCGVCYVGRALVYAQLKQPRQAYADFERACKLGQQEGCKRARQLKQLQQLQQRAGKRR